MRNSLAGFFSCCSFLEKEIEDESWDGEALRIRPSSLSKKFLFSKSSNIYMGDPYHDP